MILSRLFETNASYTHDQYRGKMESILVYLVKSVFRTMEIPPDVEVLDSSYDVDVDTTISLQLIYICNVNSEDTPVKFIIHIERFDSNLYKNHTMNGYRVSVGFRSRKHGQKFVYDTAFDSDSSDSNFDSKNHPVYQEVHTGLLKTAYELYLSEIQKNNTPR